MDYYQDSLKFIKECSKFGVKLGLDRIREILRRLGNPQDRLRTIHIAGTNGKGSTAAMLDAVLQDAAYKTGRFTSPHLFSYRERFTVNGVWIAKEQLAEIILKIKPILAAVAKEHGEPTEFEVGTVIAFEFFAAERVEVAIIEVGMGGRFDATNVIRPALSIITHLDYDHQQYLGNTIAEIAFEKAGIIKSGVPVVVGFQTSEIENYLIQIARERGAPFQLASGIKIKTLKLKEDRTDCEFSGTYFGDLKIQLNLIGEHQASNCLNVLAGLEFLSQAGINISTTNLVKGLVKTVWPSRFEKIPSISSMKLYLDGAHNPNGAMALVKTVQLLFPNQKVDLLVGILNNRPLKEMVSIFAKIANKVIVTMVPDPKTASTEELAGFFREMGIPALAEPNPEKALQVLLGTENSIAIATGSLYLTGLLRSFLIPTED